MISIIEYKKEIEMLSTEISKRIFVQKYFLHGIPFVFQGHEQKYYQFRKRIADNFKVEFYEVFVVGSSKFGFSPIRFTDFCANSDIDVVIANESLFEKFFAMLCEYQYQLNKGIIKLYKKETIKYQKFMQYFITGWMRPDLLPLNVKAFQRMKRAWNDFFQTISFGKSEVGNYRVKAGLFKNYSYAEKYYLGSIELGNKNI